MRFGRWCGVRLLVVAALVGLCGGVSRLAGGAGWAIGGVAVWKSSQDLDGESDSGGVGVGREAEGGVQLVSPVGGVDDGFGCEEVGRDERGGHCLVAVLSDGCSA